jgi:hypothetical protein
MPLGDLIYIAPTAGEFSDSMLARVQANCGARIDSVRWLTRRAQLPADAAAILIEPLALLPTRWLARLLAAIEIAPDQCIAPFCPDVAPVRPGYCLQASCTDIDAMCFALAPQALYPMSPTTAELPLHYWPVRTNSGDPAAQLLFAGMFVSRELAFHSMVTPSEPAIEAQASLLEQPWYGVCDAIATALCAGIQSQLLADPRPRLLHVLHSWGGGVERFARDIAG